MEPARLIDRGSTCARAATVRVAVAAGLFALDELIAPLLEDLLAAAAARPDEVWQTRRRVLGISGWRQDERSDERSCGIANDTTSMV